MSESPRRISGLRPRGASDLSFMLNPSAAAPEEVSAEVAAVSVPEPRTEDVVAIDQEEVASPAPRRPARKSTARASRPVSESIDTGAKVALNVTIRASISGRARTAFRATGYFEGDTSLSEFVERAIEAEVERREEKYNKGEQFEVAVDKLSPGRPARS